MTSSASAIFNCAHGLRVAPAEIVAFWGEAGPAREGSLVLTSRRSSEKLDFDTSAGGSFVRAATRLAMTVTVLFGIVVAANAETVPKQCGDQWRAEKANGTTNGQTWSQFINQCRAQYHKHHRIHVTHSSSDAALAAPEQSTPTRPVVVAPTVTAAPTVQSWQITPQQEDILASQFGSIKSTMPKRFAITDLPNQAPDSEEVEEGIHRAFARNGIDVPIETQLASSLTETGIVFTMPDPSNPPEFARKLKDAFGLVGINGIKFAAMNSEATSRLDFTIFVGLAPPK
jgi:hypothetical protein